MHELVHTNYKIIGHDCILSLEHDEEKMFAKIIFNDDDEYTLNSYDLKVLSDICDEIISDIDEEDKYTYERLFRFTASADETIFLLEPNIDDEDSVLLCIDNDDTYDLNIEEMKALYDMLTVIYDQIV